MNETKRNGVVTSLLMEMVKGFTRYHEHLRVEAGETERTIGISISAHADDVPKIIGGRGEMVSNLRTILNGMTQRQGKRVDITVEEPTVGQHEELTEFAPDQYWTRNRIEPLLRQLAAELFHGPVALRFVEVGGDKTMIELEVGADERNATTHMETAISKVIAAIGLSTGRKLRLEIPAAYQKGTRHENQPSPR